MKVYYLTVEGITSTVFNSQVLGLIKNLTQRQYLGKLFIGQKYKSRILISKFLPLFLKKNINFIFIGSIINHQKIAKRLIKKLSSSSPVILHCRNVEAAFIGVLVKEMISNKPIQIIYDVRGYVEQEKSFFNEPEREKLFESLNDKLFKSDIYFSFVSKELYKLYNKKYNISSDKVIFCNSGYNDSIFKPPTKSDTEKKLLVKILFVGGNQKYQKTEEIILALQDKKGVELTVITPKPLNIKENCSNVVLLNNLSQNEINILADNFDYGIIYRSSELFNEVATPTKISEYLGKGLKIIAINSAGAYSQLISENEKLGFLIKSESELKSIHLKKVSFNEKKIISEYAKQNLSLSMNVDKYINLYKKIHESF